MKTSLNEIRPVAIERKRILYSGSVQGVGFRWTTQRALEGLPVAGFVRNLADGRVELVVESDADVVATAIERIRRALGRYIRDEAHETLPPTGEFTSFGIRR